jgi:aldehyde:ferredoxin oxidoreductase
MVLRAASACDEAGLDTISTGGTLAFATESAERGWIDGRLPSGRRLTFGDGEAFVEAIGAIVEREGIGEWLALGSRRMAERIGGEAPSIAPHVKGLELPGYDPRRLHAMALGLAVGTRGADHNRSGAYEADFSARLDRLNGGEASVLAAIDTEDRSALMDSLILCKFVRGVFNDFHSEAAEMLRAVTGWDVTADELRTASRRIVNARKLVNIRAGWTRSEDTLPARLLEGEGNPLTRERLDAMIGAYYQHRGWTEDGLVPVGR